MASAGGAISRRWVFTGFMEIRPPFCLLAISWIGCIVAVAGKAGYACQSGMQGASAHHSGSDMAGSARRDGAIGNVGGRLATKRTSPGHSRGMAVVAIVYRSDMAGTLAHRLDAVVAGHTRAWRGVRIRCREPAQGASMAVVARVYPLDGCRAMAGRLADRRGAIVAGRADSCGAVFISGGYPTDKAMALVALIGSLGDGVMARRLADCRAAVMASRAGAGSDTDVVP